MKKLIAIILSVLMVLSLTFTAAVAEEKTFDLAAAGVDMTHSIDVNDLRIRDPYILLYQNVYFMYTGGGDNGYICYASYNLKTWYGLIRVFDSTKAAESGDFEGIGEYWAAECHIYNGSFYIFGSYRSGKSGYHGTSIFKSESPLGPFVEISNGPVTPPTRDCIDGTLYVENGTPYMVYSEELTSEADGIGGMAYAQLSEDLTHFVTEPRTMFKANDPYWMSQRNNVTDAPFVYRTSNGKLIMLWSTFCNEYATATYFNLSGKIDGEWHHSSRPLYQRDEDIGELEGGHSMIFTDKDGTLKMAFHSPNTSEYERLKIVEIEDKGNYIIRKDCSFIDKLACIVDIGFWSVADVFINIYKAIFSGC